MTRNRYLFIGTRKIGNCFDSTPGGNDFGFPILSYDFEVISKDTENWNTKVNNSTHI